MRRTELTIKVIVKDGISGGVLTGIRRHGTRDIDFHAGLKETLAEVQRQIQIGVSAFTLAKPDEPSPE